MAPRVKVGRLLRRPGFTLRLLGPFKTAVMAAGKPEDWALQVAANQILTMLQLPVKWLVIYFGYTQCPDLCPSALLDLSAIVHELEHSAYPVQPVFITIDPERDTPEILSQYLSSFDLPIIALTGTTEQIQTIAHEFDMHVVRYEDPGLVGYSFDHSSSFYLVDPERHLVADFATELPPAQIAAGVRDIIRSAGFEPRAGRAE